MITVTNYSYNVCWILKTGDSATVKSGAIVGLTGDAGYLVMIKAEVVWLRLGCDLTG